MQFEIFPLGDQGLTFQLNAKPSRESITVLAQMQRRLSGHHGAGIRDVIVAYDSLTIIFDRDPITQSQPGDPDKSISELLVHTFNNVRSMSEGIAPNLVRIPVCYDVAYGIDLQQISSQKNIAIDEIVELHQSLIYPVFMIGFLPGFPYMGFVDERISMPRRSSPRPIVRAGSVAIADRQTGIYPLDSPGGWNIIGRTPMKLFNVSSSPPVVLNSGDSVQFYAISPEQFDQLSP